MPPSSSIADDHVVMTEGRDEEQISSSRKSEPVLVTREDMMADKKERRESKVRFSDVEFREYERIVGDQTDILGPPLALGWSYNESLPISVEEFEDTRSPRRQEWELLLTPNGRRHLLMKGFGFSAEELTAAEKKIVERRKSEETKAHAETKKSGGVLKRARRKVKRAFSLDRVADAGSLLAMSSPFAVVCAR